MCCFCFLLLLRFLIVSLFAFRLFVCWLFGWYFVCLLAFSYGRIHCIDCINTISWQIRCANGVSCSLGHFWGNQKHVYLTPDFLCAIYFFSFRPHAVLREWSEEGGWGDWGGVGEDFSLRLLVSSEFPGLAVSVPWRNQSDL